MNRRSVVVVLLLALVGCDTGRSAEPAATESEVSPSAVPQDVTTIEGFAPLPPGDYFIDPDADPETPMHVTYSVPDSGWVGWIGGAKFAPEGHVAVSITAVSNLVRHGCSDHSRIEPPVGPTVDDLANALVDLRPFRVTAPPTDVTIAGFSGKHLELTVPDLPVVGPPDDLKFEDCKNNALHDWVSPLLKGAFFGHSGPGYDEEYFILDVEGERLVIVAHRSPDSPERDLEEMRSILDSIDIHPTAPPDSWVVDNNQLPASCRELVEERSPAAPQQDPVTFTNATVLTMDAERRRADTVSIQAGKIASTRGGRPVDLEGATVLPGFIDSHSHWIGDKDMVGWTAPEAAKKALTSGWTSISELFVTNERMEELCYLALNDELPVKVGAFLPLNYDDERFGNWYDDFEPRQEFGSRVWLQGIKLHADRAGDGLGHQTDPPSKATQGERFWTPKQMGAALRRADEAGWQIAVHATGDGGLDVVLEAFSTVGREAIVEGRHRVEHLTTVRDDQVRLVRKLGLIGSIQPHWFHGDAAEDLVRWVGRDRLRFAGRWRDLIEAGIPITAGSDSPWAIAGRSGPVIPLIAQAVTRMSPSGAAPPRWMRPQAMTVDEVLRALTIDAAFAQGREDSLGSIEPGKIADLVILSDDPTRVAPEDLWEIEIIAMIVDGEVEHCAKAVPADLEKLCPDP